MANNFFKNGDKAYSENLNDSILVGNAFDWTVSIGLPADNGGVFPNSSTVVKAKVADVYITPNSNLSIGSTISNSSGSSQVYRLTVYPNFNRYGGFKSISVTGSSGVTFYIANKGATSPIASNLDYSDLSSVPELKVLKEYDIVLTIPNGKSVSGLEFVFQSSSADVSGSINQSNVSGLDDRLASIETKNTQQDNRLTSLEETDEEIFNYSLKVNNYNPNIDEEVNVTVKVNDVYGVAVEGKEVTVNVSEGSFISLNGNSISSQQVTAITDNEGKVVLGYECTEWGLITFVANNTTVQIKVEGWRTIINDSNHELRVNGTFAEFRLHTDTAVYVDTNFSSLTNWVPSEYAPKHPQYELADDGRYMVRIDGTTVMYRSLSGSGMRVNLYATFLYRY